MEDIVYKPGDHVRILGGEGLCAAFNIDKGKRAVVVTACADAVSIYILDKTEKKLAFNNDFHWWTGNSTVEPWRRVGEQLVFDFKE